MILTFNLGAMGQSIRDSMNKITIAVATAYVVASGIVALFLIFQFQNELLAAFLALSFIYFTVSFLLIFLPYFLGRKRNKTKVLGAKNETDTVKTKSKSPE